jgi:hypothetical protein
MDREPEPPSGPDTTWSRVNRRSAWSQRQCAVDRRVRRGRKVHCTENVSEGAGCRGLSVPAHDERRAACSPKHVLDHGSDSQSIRAAAMGCAQDDQVRLAGASVQQNDLSCLAMLNINSDLHPSGLCSGPKFQEISDSFRRPSVEGLVDGDGVDDDQFCVVAACQGEGLRERRPSRLVNVDCAQHTREPLHEFDLRCFDSLAECRRSDGEQTTIRRMRPGTPLDPD